MSVKRFFLKAYVKLLSNNRFLNYLRRKGVSIGNDCLICKNVEIGTESYLISIENNVRITENVKFIIHDGDLWLLRNLGMIPKNADKIGKNIVGNNVNIGWDCLIFPNVIIGDNFVIGAGAIVTKNVPSNSVVAGVPAKMIVSIDEYYDKNKYSILLTRNMNNNYKRIFLENYLNGR